MISDVSWERYEIRRYTNVLYNGNVGTVSIKPNPSAEAIIMVTLDSAQTGSIYLNGNTTETLTFSADDIQKSTSLFTTLNGVTPASLSGNMKIECFDESNIPVRNLEDKFHVYGYFKVKSNEEILKLEGDRIKYIADFHTNSESSIQNSDILVRKENKVPVYYEISNVRNITSTDGNKQQQMLLEKTEI